MKYRNLGEILSQIRASRFLSLEHLADKTQIDILKLKNLEEGNYEPDFVEWSNICKALGITEKEENLISKALEKDISEAMDNALKEISNAFKALAEESKKISQFIEELLSCYHLRNPEKI